MKRFAAVGSADLGSSFMIEMNIHKALKDLGIKDYTVTYSDTDGATSDMADYFIVGNDLEKAASHLSELIVVNNIIDLDELKEVLEEVCIRDHLI